MNIVRWSNECVCFFLVQIHILPIFCVSFLWRSFPFRLALFTHKIFPLQSKWKSFECRFPLKMVKITLAKLLITGLFHFISCFFPFLFALRISTTTAADFSFIQSRSRISIQHSLSSKERKNSLNAREREKNQLDLLFNYLWKKRSSLFICKRSNILSAKKIMLQSDLIPEMKWNQKTFSTIFIGVFFQQKFGGSKIYSVRISVLLFDLNTKNCQFHSV